MNKDFILIQTQVALFFKNRLERPDKFVTSLDEKMGGIFNQAPIVMPVPDQRELDSAPVVQLRSDTFSCNIARGRTDLFYSEPGRQTYFDIEGDFILKAREFFSFFKEKTPIRRVGFVTRFFVEDEQPALTISKVMKNEFLLVNQGDIHDANVRLVTREEIFGKFSINNIVEARRVEVGIKNGEETAGHIGVQISRDFNTRPDKDYSNEFSVEKIEEFLRHGSNSFNLSQIENSLWQN